MKRLSELLKDTVLPPVEQGVWWVEYVIRHKGAHHLRPATVDMHWTQYCLLDVFAVIIAVACTIVFVGYKLVMFSYRGVLVIMKEVKLKQS